MKSSSPDHLVPKICSSLGTISITWPTQVRISRLTSNFNLVYRISSSLIFVIKHRQLILRNRIQNPNIKTFAFYTRPRWTQATLDYQFKLQRNQINPSRLSHLCFFSNKTITSKSNYGLHFFKKLPKWAIDIDFFNLTFHSPVEHALDIQ